MIRVWTVRGCMWIRNCDTVTQIWSWAFCRAAGFVSTLLLMEGVTHLQPWHLSVSCWLRQNHFTSVCLCDRTSLKVQKSISQCLQFHTRFWNRGVVWKWSGESMSANCSSRHSDTGNGQTYKEFHTPLLVLGCKALSYYGLLEALLGHGPLSRQDSGDFTLDLHLGFSLDLGSCPGLLFL